MLQLNNYEQSTKTHRDRVVYYPVDDVLGDFWTPRKILHSPAAHLSSLFPPPQLISSKNSPGSPVHSAFEACKYNCNAPPPTQSNYVWAFCVRLFSEGTDKNGYFVCVPCSRSLFENGECQSIVVETQGSKSMSNSLREGREEVWNFMKRYGKFCRK